MSAAHSALCLPPLDDFATQWPSVHPRIHMPHAPSVTALWRTLSKLAGWSIVAVVAAVGSFIFVMARACEPMPHLQDDCTIFPGGQAWCFDGRLYCLTLPSEIQKLAPNPLAKRPKKQPPPVQNCMSQNDGPCAGAGAGVVMLVVLFLWRAPPCWWPGSTDLL